MAFDVGGAWFFLHTIPSMFGKLWLHSWRYSRTYLKQYCWDRGVGIELERLLN